MLSRSPSSHGSGRSRKRAAQISIGIRPACGTSGMVSLIVLIGRAEMLRAQAFLPPRLRLRSLIYYAKLYLRQQILACS
jgi:hypothetical protein